MKKETKTKILSGLNISLGVVICFYMIKIIQIGAAGLLALLNNTPAIKWTAKHSFEGFVILFLASVTAWLGFTIGIGSINLGIKRLKVLSATKELDKLLGKMKKNYGKLNKMYKVEEDEEDKAIQNEKEQTKRFYEK